MMCDWDEIYYKDNAEQQGDGKRDTLLFQASRELQTTLQ